MSQRDEEYDLWIFITCISVTVAIAASVWTANYVTRSWYQSEAVKHNAAYYDTVNGKPVWKWRE